MEFLKVVPKWLLIGLALYAAVLLTYGVIAGRSVTFWPPSIAGAIADTTDTLAQLQTRNQALETTVTRLQGELATKASSFSETDAINAFPEEVRREDLRKTAEAVARLLHEAGDRDKDHTSLQEKLRGLQSKFLYRLLSFQEDVNCFGDSLNFTYVSNNPETQTCTTKAQLAKRFLGFLAEIEFYRGPVTESPEIAREELIKYQESKNFSRTGWYGRDVFKWIVIDYYQRT